MPQLFPTARRPRTAADAISNSRWRNLKPHVRQSNPLEPEPSWTSLTDVAARILARLEDTRR